MPLNTTFGEIGQVPNNSVLQGIIKNTEVTGVVTSTWNPRSGGTSKIVVKGTQLQITSLAQECQAVGLEYNISGGKIFTIEILYYIDVITNHFDSEPEPISFWELNYNQTDRGVLELTDRPFISALTQGNKKNIEQKLKNDTLRFTADENFANSSIAYNLKLVGIEGRKEFFPTLKRNAIMSSRYPNLSNVAGWNNARFNNSLMTTPILLQRYNVGNPLGLIPQTILSQLPTTLNVFDLRGQDTQDRSGFVISRDGIVTFIGWLQFPVDTQQIAINKVQATQMWMFGQWSAGDYGLYNVFNDAGGYLNITGIDPKEVVLGNYNVP